MQKPVEKMIRLLEKEHGTYEKPLAVSGNPSVFRLLIRTILAARNTDENAMAAASELFRHYKTPENISKAPILHLMKLVKRGVFYRVKARNIKQLCRILVSKYNGKVPKTMDELTSLPGVGRKTANIVMTYGFAVPSGIAVDTHVFRVVNRIGIVKASTPLKTEDELLKVVPKNYWIDFNRLFVLHGRNICKARKPECSRCKLINFCDYYKKFK